MKLYTYQEDYLRALPPSCIMAADLGTGKTLHLFWKLDIVSYYE